MKRYTCTGHNITEISFTEIDWSFFKFYTICRKIYFFTEVENKEHQHSPKQTIGSKSELNGLDITGSSLASKLIMQKNSIGPDKMNQILEEYRKGSRPYVLKPKYTSPTSLPLYFYFGYQLLQELEAMKQSGHVSLECIAKMRYQMYFICHFSQKPKAIYFFKSPEWLTWPSLWIDINRRPSFVVSQHLLLKNY